MRVPKVGYLYLQSTYLYICSLRNLKKTIIIIMFILPSYVSLIYYYELSYIYIIYYHSKYYYIISLACLLLNLINLRFTYYYFRITTPCSIYIITSNKAQYSEFHQAQGVIFLYS